MPNPTKLTVNNPPKAMILLLLIIVATILRALDQIDQVTFVALVGPIGGYAVGNGIAAKNDQTVEPVFTAATGRHHRVVVVDPETGDEYHAVNLVAVPDPADPPFSND